MPDIITGTVKYPANQWMDGEYGKYADAVFTSDDVPDDEIKVYGDKDTDRGKALFELDKGDSYQLLYKGQGKAKLQDSDVEHLTGGRQQQPSPRGQQQPQSQPQTDQDADLQHLAKEHARLIANTYAFLDKKFAAQQQNVNQMPTSADLQKMAVSAAIEAVKSA